MDDLLSRISTVLERQDFRMCVPPESDDTDIVLEECRNAVESLRQQLAAALAACDAKDARFKQIVRMANHLDVLSIAMQAHDILATKPDASALKAHDEALIEKIAAFVETQRNDVPACGFEFANTIRELKGTL